MPRTVTHGHGHFPKQGGTRAGARGTVSVLAKPPCCALMSVENSLFGWKSGGDEEPNASYARRGTKRVFCWKEFSSPDWGGDIRTLFSFPRRDTCQWHRAVPRAWRSHGMGRLLRAPRHRWPRAAAAQMEPGKMEASGGGVWAWGCLPVARTRAESRPGAGSAVGFKTAPRLPRTLLSSSSGTGWVDPGPAVHLVLLARRCLPVRLRSSTRRCGAGRQGGVCYPHPLHAWPRGQGARGHPWVPSGQGTPLPGKLLPLGISWHCPQLGGSQEPLSPAWWSPIWDHVGEMFSVPPVPASRRARAEGRSEWV